MSRPERKAMVRRDVSGLSLSRQCEILSISRSSLYYRLRGESPANLALMRRIDELFLKHPFYGSRQMESLTDKLKTQAEELLASQQESQKTLEELEKSARINQLLTENSNDFIGILDVNGKYNYISPSSERVLGYKPEELLGRETLTDLVHPDDREQLLTYRKTVAEGKRPNLAPILIRVIKKQGEVRWQEISVSYVPNLDGKDTADILVATHDVHEIIENQQALETSRKQLLAQAKTMAQDVELAKTMQEAILPRDFPVHPNYEIRAFMKAAGMVGGDFYDYFDLGGSRIGLVIADVSGKGVPAAFFMSMTRVVMETEARKGLDPGEVLVEVNKRLLEHNPVSLFVTMFYGIIDLKTGNFIYSNGGHNNPFIVRDNENVEELRPTKDVAIGVVESDSYVQEEVSLLPGDTLFLYTDGITEAFDKNENMFDELRLINSLKNKYDYPLETFLNTVLEDVRDFVGGNVQSDDLTCIAFRYKANA